jgi:glycosyltransferase involved in cell wall biosynthesis
MVILFLSPWFPYPPNNGSKIRIYNLLIALSKNYDIDLISFVREEEIVNLTRIESLTRSVTTVPWREFNPGRLKAIIGYASKTPRYLIDTYSHEMADQITATINKGKPSLVIASQLSTARYLKNLRNVPMIFEEVELGIYRTNQEEQRTLDLYRKSLTWQKMKAYIGNLVQNFNACTVVSELEHAYLRECNKTYHEIYTISNGINCHTLYPGLASQQPKKLIFNGALTYQANFEAIRYFLQEIYPIIQQKITDVKFVITGSTRNVKTNLLPLDDSIQLTGHLTDIRTSVASASICVVPIKSGGGTRLKILEAMALGTPVVSTSKGAEGIATTPEKNILIGDDPDTFAKQVIRLINDPYLRADIARDARALVDEYYCWEKITPVFLDLVENTIRAHTGIAD